MSTAQSRPATNVTIKRDDHSITRYSWSDRVLSASLSIIANGHKWLRPRMNESGGFVVPAGITRQPFPFLSRHIVTV